MKTMEIKGIQFGDSRKFGGYGTHRTVSPAETISRIKPLLPLIGATRVADLTGQDRLGIPVTSVTVPTDRGGISVNNGKGLTVEAAMAGGMMESIERFSAEEIELPVVVGTFEDLSRTHNVMNPNEIPFFIEVERDLRKETLEWLPGVELFSGEQILIPANVVGIPWNGQYGKGIWLESTNGLGSGNVMEEAICHGLNEVIERDAQTLAVLKAKLRPNMAHYIEGAEAVGVDATGFDLIDLATLPPKLQAMAQRIEAAGLSLIVRDVTSDIQVPTFAAAIVEETWEGKFFCHGGAGTHPDAEVALERSITEAAQSRLTDFQGTREDMTEQAPSEAPDEMSFLTSTIGNVKPFQACPTFQHETVEGDVRCLLGALHDAGLTRVYMVDLTRSELQVPVVRIIVPGLEMWATNHFDTRGVVLGERAKSALGFEE